MSKLEELEEELYGKGNEERLAKRTQRRIVFSRGQGKTPTSWAGRKDAASFAVFSSQRIFKFFIGTLAVLFMIGGAVFVFLYLSTRGQEARVEIQGRDQLESGELITIPVVFRNLSKVVLKEVELAIILPEGSLLIEEGLERLAPSRLTQKISDLGPSEDGYTEITVRLFGQEREAKKVEAILFYRPENLRARFSARNSRELMVARVPLALFWEAPEIISQGQAVDFKVHYISNARTPFPDLSLRLEYPPGFSFKSASPLPDVGENIWKAGTIEAGREGMITVRGFMTGEEGDIKTIRGGIGIFNQLTKEWRPYVESSREVKIAVRPLSVQGFLGGGKDTVVVPGERLSFLIKYKNNTESFLKDITIHVGLEGAILEMNTLLVGNNGVFDSSSRAVVWNAGVVPALAELKPGEGGELAFSVGTKSSPAVRSASDKNLLVSLRSKIEAAGVPQELAGTELRFEEKLEFKVRSKVLFSAKALYRSSPIVNSGPLPPRVDSKTTYTILWEIRNFTSDLQNVEVRALLPPNIKWENVWSPKGSRLSFNAGGGEIRWAIDTVKAGTGVITPALTIVFQVAVTPAEADLDKPLILLNGSRLSALDIFTGKKIEEEAGTLTTELRDDPTTVFGDWRVVR